MKPNFNFAKTIVVFFFIAVSLISCSTENKSVEFNHDEIKEVILNLEKEALDKWLNKQTSGFINLFDSNVTYFDEGTKLRIDGFKELKNYIEPFEGLIYVPKYKILNPSFIIQENLVVLTYNLDNFSEEDKFLLRWNCTEVYKLEQGSWKIAHSHWSIVNKEKE